MQPTTELTTPAGVASRPPHRGDGPTSMSVPEVSSSVVRGLVKTMRPHQWVKNLFVLAPMFFHRDVFLATSQGPALNLTVAGRALAATIIFCLLAGAIYTINDIVDVSADRLHPI